VSIQWDANKNVAGSIFETIGRTPLVKLNSVTRGMKTQVMGKIEYFSPTGSLKDRIFYRMITQAIKRGDLRPGMTIIESSTGNAGIACAFVGKMLGYSVVVVMPAGMSEERKMIMRAYGARIIETPGAESDVDLCLEKVEGMMAAEPGKYWKAGQYTNLDNIEAHYTTTGPEIWEQTGGEVDIFLATQGTGGTLTGIGRYLRQMKPEVKLFAVEPTEAPMLARREWGSHRIEGIGDGFVPRNLDLSMLDGIVLTTSDEAVEMGKRLALEEGIFCGISSGSNVAAALKVAQRYPEAGVIVTMINDTGQRYFSTELCGVRKEIEIPEREHPMDEYTREQLDKYQAGWAIIE
jgi:cysteine synthase A